VVLREVDTMKLSLLAAALALAPISACRDDDVTTSSTFATGAAIAPPTAGDQSNRPEDLAIVGRVRRRLVADPSLSFGAKNAVVIVRDGVVTLRGDVASRVEHELVLASVLRAPGVVRIDDHLTNAARSRP
jgi:osmotically-inducible protein OsmY